MSLSYVSAPRVHIGQCSLFNSFFPLYQRLVVENATKFHRTLQDSALESESNGCESESEFTWCESESA